MRSSSPKSGLRHRSAPHQDASGGRDCDTAQPLDEQEQDDVVRRLRSEVIRQAGSIRRTACLASVAGAVIVFSSTLLYAVFFLFRRGGALWDGGRPVSESTLANERGFNRNGPRLPSESLSISLVVLFGVFSTWMHLVAAYICSGGVSIGGAVRCSNSNVISHVMSFLHRDGFRHRHGRGEGPTPAATASCKEDGRLHVFGGLGVTIPFLSLAFLNASSSSADDGAGLVTFLLFLSTSNMFTMFAAIVVQRDASFTLASVDELERAKYRYKSL